MLRRCTDVKAGGVGGVKEELGEAGGGTRRSSGRLTTMAMVEQLVPLDISRAAARGGAQGGGQQRPWWSGGSNIER
jgi:hypothetical protein